ncbi:MAG: hypothetical protein KDA44_14920 [Planctomycetales bacterium]|nr:hypothetical protein [Planctomycetales bacterium]
MPSLSHRQWLILAMALLEGCGAADPQPVFPQFSEVAKVTATVVDDPMGEPAMSEPFSVPPDYVAALLEALSPPVYDQLPPEKWLNDVARLKIELVDGRIVDVRVVFYGKEAVRYVVDGVPCLRGGAYRPIEVSIDQNYDFYSAESFGVAGFLNALRKGNVAEAEEVLQVLKRSAGKLPPEDLDESSAEK